MVETHALESSIDHNSLSFQILRSQTITLSSNLIDFYDKTSA